MAKKNTSAKKKGNQHKKKLISNIPQKKEEKKLGDGIVELGKHFKEEGDDYNYVLIHTLANRFAEAFAEYTHQKMRDIWGIGAEPDRGIRPAPGYPTCPDHSQKALLFKLLNATKNTGISLTESYMMSPVSSVCAWVFSHPSSNYFTVKY